MGNIMEKKCDVITRRAFNKATMMAAAVLSYDMMVPALARPLASADAFLHLTKQGVIEIHSGAGHQPPYGERSPRDIIAEVLGCSPDICKIQFGDNPRQLPAIMGWSARIIWPRPA